MVVVILFAILSILLPLMILRRFSFSQKLLVLVIILLHLGLMFFLHYRLVRKTGHPIVIDDNDDAQMYYNETAHFANYPPFRVTRSSAIAASAGSRHYGYSYMLGVLWTITAYPVLAARILKTLLFFLALSCLVRLWRSIYSPRIAMIGFFVMGVILMPEFYWNFRNLKDSLILTVFLFIMAILDTLFESRQDILYPMSHQKRVFLWLLLLVPLYVLSTLRMYLPVLLVMAIVMHSMMASNMRVGSRVSLLIAMFFVTLITIRISVVYNILGIYSDIAGGGFQAGGGGGTGLFNPYTLFHSVVSPIPWQYTADPPLVTFHLIYLASLPYILYCFLKHLRKNIDWHLFMYILVMSVVAMIGSGSRKRITVYPILMVWALRHLHYKQMLQSTQAEDYESQISQNYDYKYNQEYVLAEPGEGYSVNVDSSQ